jgi:hypothetical protein
MELDKIYIIVCSYTQYGDYSQYNYGCCIGKDAQNEAESIASQLKGYYNSVKGVSVTAISDVDTEKYIYESMRTVDPKFSSGSENVTYTVEEVDVLDYPYIPLNAPPIKVPVVIKIGNKEYVGRTLDEAVAKARE